MVGRLVKPPSTGRKWFWRWGAPLAAGAAALAAVAVLAAVSLGLDAMREVDKVVPPRELATAAAAFAVALLAFWAATRAEGPAAPGACHVASRRCADAMAAAAMLTGAALAAHGLDGPYGPDELPLQVHLSQSLAGVASSYDYPNNHVLHTLLAWVAHHFGGWNRVVLRLPAFISFCLLLPALWWFVRQEYGPSAAVFATALASSSPYMLAYATSARGYTLMMLMFATALLCARALVRDPERKALWATWTAAVALGFFAVPLMVFPAATTVAWMLLARRRRCGSEAFAPFLGRTAAWSAGALVVAGALYLPILTTTDVVGVQEAVRAREHQLLGSIPLWAHPGQVWRDWHWTTPAWARGTLLALIVVGVAASVRGLPSDPTRRPGAALLLLATGLATGFLLLAFPFRPRARMLTWMLLVLLVAAGVGAAFVLERLLTHSAARWRGAAARAGRRALECAAPAAALGAFSWWALTPDSLKHVIDPFHAPTGRLVLTSSVDEHMRAGDYFTTCGLAEHGTMIHMKAVHPVDEDVAVFFEAGRDTRQAVHRLSLADGSSDTSRRRASRAEASPGRLFLLEPFKGGTRRRCRREAPLPGRFLEAHWPNHEQVAAFHHGRVYVVHEWTEGG